MVSNSSHSKGHYSYTQHRVRFLEEPEESEWPSWFPGQQQQQLTNGDLHSNENKYTRGNWIPLSFHRMNFLPADCIVSSGGVNIQLRA